MASSLLLVAKLDAGITAAAASATVTTVRTLVLRVIAYMSSPAEDQMLSE
jgi:hypothetical protein